MKGTILFIAIYVAAAIFSVSIAYTVLRAFRLLQW